MLGARLGAQARRAARKWRWAGRAGGRWAGRAGGRWASMRVGHAGRAGRARG